MASTTERDSYELALIKRAIELDKPMLCICRGIQVLNVALGGTLNQHLADDQDPTAFIGSSNGVSKLPGPATRFRTSVDGLLRQLTGSRGRWKSIHLHHQGLGSDRRRVARRSVSDDGVVESVFGSGCGFALGVQWHPEMMFQTVPQQNALFDAFVEWRLPRN